MNKNIPEYFVHIDTKKFWSQDGPFKVFYKTLIPNILV